MKVNRNYTIDADLVELLKGMNASELINTLLSEHFAAENGENLIKIRQKTKELMQERALFSKKIAFLKQKASKIQEKRDEEKRKNTNSEEKLKRKAEIENIKQKYFNEEISEEEYWEFFNEN